MYRQGDVLVVPIDESELSNDLIPAPRESSGRLVLAYGEATGHAHVVSGEGPRLLCLPRRQDAQLAKIYYTQSWTAEPTTAQRCVSWLAISLNAPGP
jgi:hypothetical protein